MPIVRYLNSDGSPEMQRRIGGVMHEYTEVRDDDGDSGFAVGDIKHYGTHGIYRAYRVVDSCLGAWPGLKIVTIQRDPALDTSPIS